MMLGRGTVPMFSTVPIVNLNQWNTTVHSLTESQSMEESSSTCMKNNENEAFQVASTTGQDQTSIPFTEPFRILLMGTADTGYILKAMTMHHPVEDDPKTSASHPSVQRNIFRPLHFYVAEPQIPLIARHILFLYIWFDPSLQDWSTSDKEELYFELYGNLKLTQKTHTWLQSEIPHLIRMVTDQNSLVSTYLDLTALKYKERDELEMVFKFWKSNRPLDLNRLWEQRLMAYYQSRYDVRENLIDWDYHMKLSTKLPNLPKPAFFRWRLSGNAFDTKDTLGSYPNRTLVTTMQGRGGGYWSDILHSPLVGFHSSSLSKKNTQVHGQPSFLHMKEGVPKVTLLTTQDSKQWKKYSQVDITCIGISMVFSYLHLCTSNRVLIESMEYALEDKETQEKYLEKVKSDMETLGYRMDDMHKVAGYIVFVKKNNSEVSLSPAM